MKQCHIFLCLAVLIFFIFSGCGEDDPSPEISTDIEWLSTIWGENATEVYTAGYKFAVDGAIILNGSGSNWQTAWESPSGLNGAPECPACFDIRGLWVSPNGHVFGVGAPGAIVHGVDGAFSIAMCASDWPKRTGDFEDVFGFSTGDVFAVGNDRGYWEDYGSGGTQGRIAHFDGVTWELMDVGPCPPLNSIWGPSPESVYVTGDNGTLLHYDGSSWTRVGLPTTETLRGIWGSSDEDIYIAAGKGSILHKGVNGWGVDLEGTSVEDVFGFADGPIFATANDDTMGWILRKFESTWEREVGYRNIRTWKIWGSSPTNIYVCALTQYSESKGTQAIVYQFNGSEWIEAIDFRKVMSKTSGIVQP